MSEQLYTTVKASVVMDSADYPNLNRFDFAKLVDEEFAKFMTGLPKDVEYLALFAPKNAQVLYHYITVLNGTYPAVRQVTMYNAVTDGNFVRFDAEYLQPVDMVGSESGIAIGTLNGAVLEESAIVSPVVEAKVLN